MNFGIIAAGEGSRLAQEGVELPKPLVNLCGTPMIKRLIDIFLRAGAERICVIVNSRMTEVREFLESIKPGLPVELDIIVKTTPSSMHSFHELGKLLRGHGRFIVTTVDTIFREDDFHGYVKSFADAPGWVDGMMAMTSFIDDEKPLYIETGGATESEIREECEALTASDSTRMTEKIIAFRDTGWDGARYVSGGIYGLSDPALDVLDDCLESGVSRMRNFQRALVAAGLNIQGYDMGKIIDVDHAGDIPKAEEFILS